MTKFSRRMALGFIAGATTVSMASAAFACTEYFGKVTVSDYIYNPVTATDTTQVNSVSADGAKGSHAECPIPGADSVTSGTGSFAYAKRPAPIDLTGNFTVSVGKTTTCAAVLLQENSLADHPSATVTGTWDIKWLNMTLLPVTDGVPGTSDPSKVVLKPWCFNNLYPSTVVGSLSVSISASGVASGSGTGTQPSGTDGIGYVQICVDKQGVDTTNGARPSPPSVYLEVV